jgi:hypothetical protein
MDGRVQMTGVGAHVIGGDGRWLTVSRSAAMSYDEVGCGGP